MNKLNKFIISDAILPFILVAILIISGLSLFSYGFYAPEKNENFQGNISTNINIPDFGNETCYDFECMQNHDIGCSTTAKYCGTGTQQGSSTYVNDCYSSYTMGMDQSTCSSNNGYYVNDGGVPYCLTNKTQVTADTLCVRNAEEINYEHFHNGTYYSEYGWYNVGTSGGHSRCKYSTYDEIVNSQTDICSSSNTGASSRVTSSGDYIPPSTTYYLCQSAVCSGSGLSGGGYSWRYGNSYLCTQDEGEINIGTCNYSANGTSEIKRTQVSTQCYTYKCEQTITPNGQGICGSAVPNCHVRSYNDDSGLYNITCFQYKEYALSVSTCDANHAGQTHAYSNGYCYYGDYVFYDNQHDGCNDYSYTLKRQDDEPHNCSTGYRTAVNNNLCTYAGNVGDTQEVTAKFIITYDNNGGEGCTEKEIPYSVESFHPGELCTPTRTYYNFDGWYTAKTGGTLVNANSYLDSNTTLYAHWTVQDGYFICQQYECLNYKSMPQNTYCVQNLGSEYPYCGRYDTSTDESVCYHEIAQHVIDSYSCQQGGGYWLSSKSICLKGEQRYEGTPCTYSTQNVSTTYKWVPSGESYACLEWDVDAHSFAVPEGALGTCSSYQIWDSREVRIG